MNAKSRLHYLAPALAALLAATCLAAGVAGATASPGADLIDASSTIPANAVLDKEATKHLEDLIRLHRLASGIADDEASCEVYGWLKRPDEKYVTERAYDNPKFVEDLVRDIALRLKREPRVASFIVESENFESIHNHSAYARIEGRNG